MPAGASAETGRGGEEGRDGGREEDAPRLTWRVAKLENAGSREDLTPRDRGEHRRV